MATDKDVTKLNSYVKKLDKFLRDQQLWAKTVTSNLRRLNRKAGSIGPGPNITDPPPPPRKP